MGHLSNEISDRNVFLNAYSKLKSLSIIALKECFDRENYFLLG